MNLSTWFLEAFALYQAGEPTLPTPPFSLSSWLTVTGDTFYETLKADVEQVIAHRQGRTSRTSPRFRNEALQSDLRRLYRITAENSQSESA